MTHAITFDAALRGNTATYRVDNGTRTSDHVYLGERAGAYAMQVFAQLISQRITASDVRAKLGTLDAANPPEAVVLRFVPVAVEAAEAALAENGGRAIDFVAAKRPTDAMVRQLAALEDEVFGLTASAEAARAERAAWIADDTCRHGVSFSAECAECED